MILLFVVRLFKSLISNVVRLINKIIVMVKKMWEKYCIFNVLMLVILECFIILLCLLIFLFCVFRWRIGVLMDFEFLFLVKLVGIIVGIKGILKGIWWNFKCIVNLWVFFIVL